MKKTVAICFAFLMCSPAIAQWTRVGGSDTAQSYIDLQTVQRSGNLVKVWILYDNLRTDSDGTNSTKSQEEFNCQSAESRTTFAINHSGRMASGKVLFSWKPEGGWAPIPPGVVIWTILKKVC